jgi:hypothetical protein
MNAFTAVLVCIYVCVCMYLCQHIYTKIWFYYNCLTYLRS